MYSTILSTKKYYGAGPQSNKTYYQLTKYQFGSQCSPLSEYFMSINNQIETITDKTMVDPLLCDLIEKMELIKNKKSDYMCDPDYICLLSLKNGLDTVYKAIICEEQLEDFKAETYKLQKEISQYYGVIAIRESIGLNIDCGIKTEYLKYIELYGVPLDGIFDPSKLMELVGC
jgi:hypothetical protein